MSSKQLVTDGDNTNNSSNNNNNDCGSSSKSCDNEHDNVALLTRLHTCNAALQQRIGARLAAIDRELSYLSSLRLHVCQARATALSDTAPHHTRKRTRRQQQQAHRHNGSNRRSSHHHNEDSDDEDEDVQTSRRLGGVAAHTQWRVVCAEPPLLHTTSTHTTAAAAKTQCDTDNTDDGDCCYLRTHTAPLLAWEGGRRVRDPFCLAGLCVVRGSTVARLLALTPCRDVRARRVWERLFAPPSRATNATAAAATATAATAMSSRVAAVRAMRTRTSPSRDTEATDDGDMGGKHTRRRTRPTLSVATAATAWLRYVQTDATARALLAGFWGDTHELMARLHTALQHTVRVRHRIVAAVTAHSDTVTTTTCMPPLSCCAHDDGDSDNNSNDDDDGDDDVWQSYSALFALPHHRDLQRQLELLTYAHATRCRDRDVCEGNTRVRLLRKLLCCVPHTADRHDECNDNNDDNDNGNDARSNDNSSGRHPPCLALTSSSSLPHQQQQQRERSARTRVTPLLQLVAFLGTRAGVLRRLGNSLGVGEAASLATGDTTAVREWHHLMHMRVADVFATHEQQQQQQMQLQQQEQVQQQQRQQYECDSDSEDDVALVVLAARDCRRPPRRKTMLSLQQQQQQQHRRQQQRRSHVLYSLPHHYSPSSSD